MRGCSKDRKRSGQEPQMACSKIYLWAGPSPSPYYKGKPASLILVDLAEERGRDVWG